MPVYHIAQVNLGRVRARVDNPLMADFMNGLDEINALAERSPGFVWRLQTDEGNATYFRPYPHDDRILLNMSVWTGIEELKQFVYRTAHAEYLRRRHEWFEVFDGVYAALWWIPAGHVPGIDEARKRIAHLDAHGPTEFAFTFKSTFTANPRFQESIDWAAFEPCPAA